MDIHDYSSAQVNVSVPSSGVSTSPEGLNPSPPGTNSLWKSRKMTSLNAAIMTAIEQRIGHSAHVRGDGNDYDYSKEEVSEILSDILTSGDDFSEQQQEQAVHYLERLLDEYSAHIIGKCLRFLETLQ